MILQIFNSSIVSGPETLIGPNLARSLSEEVLILNLSESRLAGTGLKIRDYFERLGFRFHEIPVERRVDVRAILALRRVIETERPRVIHSHDVKASIFLAIATFGLKDRPLLLSTHHGTIARSGIVRLYEELYVRVFLRCFDRVLVVCDVDRSSLLKRGISSKKIQLHSNGKSLEPVDLAQKESLSRQRWTHWRTQHPDLSSKKPKMLLGAIARLSPEKRHDRMLLLLRELTQNDPSLDIELILFGSGPLEAELRTQAASLGLQSKVHFMSYSPNISEDLLGIDLLLCLSDGEGLPMNLIEGGWRGVPFIGTHVGGVPDLVQPDWRLTVSMESPVQDAKKRILELYHAPDELERLRSVFQTRISQQFSKDAWIKRYKTIIQSTEQDASVS